MTCSLYHLTVSVIVLLVLRTTWPIKLNNARTNIADVSDRSLAKCGLLHWLQISYFTRGKLKVCATEKVSILEVS